MNLITIISNSVVVAKKKQLEQYQKEEPKYQDKDRKIEYRKDLK